MDVSGVVSVLQGTKLTRYAKTKRFVACSLALIFSSTKIPVILNVSGLDCSNVG